MTTNATLIVTIPIPELDAVRRLAQHQNTTVEIVIRGGIQLAIERFGDRRPTGTDG